MTSPSQEKRGYLLSGASGMLGSGLRQAFAARHLPVLQLVRPRAQRWGRWFGAAGPAELDGQLPWNPAATPPIAQPAALEGYAAAIHLAGANVAAHRWTAAYKREMSESRVQSPRALATCLASLSQPPKTLVVASAIGIYGNRHNEFLDESSAPGSGFLAHLCEQWEAAAQPAVGSGIRVGHL